jgi:hypothetical protein
MTPLPPVASTLRCRLQWSDSADIDCFNNLYFRYTGSPMTEANAVAFAAAIFTDMAALAALWIADTQLTGVVVTDLDVDSGSQGEHDGSVAGTNEGNPLTGGSAVVIGGQIARRYRGGKPRNYFPWGSSSDLVTRQSWTGAYLTLVGTNFASFIATVIGTTEGSITITEHVNVSYYSGSTGSISGDGKRGITTPTRRAVPVVDIINGSTVRTSPGSQRRRNRS